MRRAVNRGLSRQNKTRSSKHLCVDEVAFKKGQKYITVISDTNGQVLTLEDNHGIESLSRYFNRLSNKQLTSIKIISMDMSLAYISATLVHLDNAVDKIAFDHFHVAKMLCLVIDKTRQNELNKITRDWNRRHKYPSP